MSKYKIKGGAASSRVEKHRHVGDIYTALDIGGSEGQHIGKVKLSGTGSEGRMFYVPRIHVEEGEILCFESLKDIKFVNHTRIILESGSLLHVQQDGYWYEWLIEDEVVLSGISEIEAMIGG